MINILDLEVYDSSFERSCPKKRLLATPIFWQNNIDVRCPLPRTMIFENLLLKNGALLRWVATESQMVEHDGTGVGLGEVSSRGLSMLRPRADYGVKMKLPRICLLLVY